MTTLHLVRRSAFADQQFALCIQVLQPEDTIILMDDGCYNVNHALITQAQSIIEPANIKLISTHASARNIEDTPFTHIDMANMLPLTFSHNNIITWQ